MPEPVLYFRGFPSDILGARVNERMLADLKSIAELDDDHISTLRRRLSEAKGFLDPKSLQALVREVVQDDRKSASVQRALRSLSPTDVEALLRNLADRPQEEDSPLSQNDLARLQDVLPQLIQAYPALVRFEKAERLATVTGQRLESLELICDLRPIFDDNRRRLEGMIPYTRLRVVATGADGLPDSFEAELTRQQVHDLAEKASKAKVKLDVLCESVGKWVPHGLPDLSLTRISPKESNNA